MEERDELLRADVLRVGVRPGRDHPQDLLRGEYGEEVRERRARDRRYEEVSAGLSRGRCASVGISGEMRTEQFEQKGGMVRTLTNSAQLLRNALGLSTCSITSIEHTTSNCFGPRRARSSSTEVCSYARVPLLGRAVLRSLGSSDARGAVERRILGSAEACREAMAMLDWEASMPVVFEPRRVKV